MDESYKKYLKYKKKYLELKTKFKGGFNQKNILVNPKYCNNKLQGSVYLPEICGNDFPCLNKDKNCYELNGEIDRKFNGIPIMEDIKESLFNEGKFEQINLYSSINKNLPVMLRNLIPLGEGGISKVYQLFDLKTNNMNGLLKLENIISVYLNPEKQKEIVNKMVDNFLKENPDTDKDRAELERAGNYQIENEWKNGLKRKMKNRLENLEIQMRLVENNNYVCKLYDYGKYQIVNSSIVLPGLGVYSIIEDIKGRDLFDRIENFKYVDNISVFKKLMFNILSGLDLIHKKGFLHMDIKTENIMMVNEQPNNNIYSSESEKIKVNSEIKLIDFDSIVKIGDQINKETIRGGTPQFLPKDLNIARVSPTSQLNYESYNDLYQVGVMMIVILFLKDGSNQDDFLKILEDNRSKIENDLYELITDLIDGSKKLETSDLINFFKDNESNFIPINMEMEESSPERKKKRKMEESSPENNLPYSMSIDSIPDKEIANIFNN